MQLTTSEQIRLVLMKKCVSIGELAKRLGQSRQNFSNKLSRDNFSISELYKIAEVLEIRYESHFIMQDGTEI